jgi:peptide-methionine (S)-S-oxide reductase
MQEFAFAKLPGVVKTRVGYTGGSTSNPTYETVCRGDGHTEAMRVWFDPSVMSYEALLEVRLDSTTLSR